MSLLTLQREVAGHLMDGSTALSARICGDGLLRLAVYYNAYRLQLLDCLRDTFEKTWSWLGDAQFDWAALRHIETHPPRSWTLSDYGGEFERTLEALYPQDAEVAELAWLDWAMRRAFDGPNAVPMTRAALGFVNWETAVLHAVPTLRVRSISTNCTAIWSAIAHEAIPPAAKRLTEPTALRVWRQELTPRFRSIDTVEREALEKLLAGESFAAICAAIEARQTAAAATVGTFLGTWIQDDLIIAAS